MRCVTLLLSAKALLCFPSALFSCEFVDSADGRSEFCSFLSAYPRSVSGVEASWSCTLLAGNYAQYMF